jgi:peptidyl-prolyl cis-trans isomerase C
MKPQTERTALPRLQFALLAAMVGIAPMPVLAAANEASGAPVATVNGRSIPQARFEHVLRERLAQGQQDSPELRSFLKQSLINLEVLAQESVARGLDKNPEVQLAIDLARQQILANVYQVELLRKNQPGDAALKSEYEKIKAQMGDKEYRARHILLKTEDEAKEALAQLAKGGKFETIASERSLDTGSKANGGDLNWAPAGRYVKPFADALVKLKKGETTRAAVQTQFGWHIIQLQDERPLKVPSFDESKGQLVQMMNQQALQKAVTDLRAKAKVTE